jgi:hypothetical protein
VQEFGSDEEIELAAQMANIPCGQFNLCSEILDSMQPSCVPILGPRHLASISYDPLAAR